jgi:hypothetical protein
MMNNLNYSKHTMYVFTTPRILGNIPFMSCNADVHLFNLSSQD